MGSYGIGVTRLLAAIVEAHHDAQGIVWPLPVAPYPIHLVAAGKEEASRQAAEELYAALGTQAVLYDDRDASPGIKFKDADLLGMPLRVTAGARALAQGCVELRHRATGAMELLPLREAPQALRRLATVAAR